MAGLFEDILTNLQEKKQEGKIQGGYRYKDGKLNIGGGYYGDDSMFEVDVNKDGGNILFKKRFADGGSTNGSAEKAFSAKVNELMDDGYDFGEAVKEAMRQGYKKGGKVSEALLKRINNTQGVIYTPTKDQFKVRNFTRGAEEKTKIFKIKDYKTPALALQAAKKYHYDTVLSSKAVEKRIGRARTESASQKNTFTQDINKWTEDWFKNNSKNFSIKNGDEALKALSDDFKKTDFYKIKGPKKSFIVDGKLTLPNVGTLASSSSPATNVFKMNNVSATNLISKSGSIDNFFKSTFLAEKLAKDPQLKNAAAEYMKYVTEDKIRMTYDAREKKLKNLERNPRLQEAISLIEDSDLKVSGKSKFFTSQFGNVYTDYTKKTGSSAYDKHIKLIEKTLGPKLLKQMMGTTKIKNFMLKERKALKDIFDTSPLTKGKSAMTSLGYSTEHVLGIADIARMKNKTEMAKALNTLSGMTTKKNSYLGRKVFNNNRKYLISQIDKGVNPKENLTKLNKLINKYTDIKGTAGKIVNGKFTYNEAAFKTTTQSQRFKQYLTELYNIPEGRAEIIRQSKNNVRLAQIVGIIENNRSANGLYSFPANLENIQIPESVKKALNVAGKVVKVAGKATGVVEPMFAAYNFSDAIGKGAGGKNSGQYMVEKFFEDVANIPGLVYGAGKFGIDKIRGKGTKAGPFDYIKTKTKFKTPYEATFARDQLKENLESMPKSQKLRNIAEKDFDVGPGTMRMVDYMDVSPSKTEMDKAKEKYVENQMGPYYKYGIESLPRKVAKPDEYDIYGRKVYNN